MSDSDAEAFPRSLQSRRLSLRNSRIKAAQLAYGPPYSHRKRSSSGLSPLRQATVDAEDDAWESDAAASPGLDNDGSSNRSSMLSVVDAARRTRAPSPSYLHAPLHRRGRSPDGSGKYIEHLERQVADLTNQLQGYTSASSSTSHAAKMWKLSAENRTLRHEIAEWETDFTTRVDEEVAGRQVVDESLKMAVGELELKLEDAEYQLRAANADAKGLRKRCDLLKGIEEENQSLQFKIETLSELLAASATTMERRLSDGDYARPSRAVPPQRIGSPVGSPLDSAPASAPVSVAGSRRVSKESGSFRGMEDYGITDPIDHIFAMQQEDGSGGADSPIRSRSSSSSSSYRRMSGMPPRSPTPGEMSPNPRTRRMRKFPSGSTALKTLILPSATAVSSSTHSVFSSPTRPISTDFAAAVQAPNFDAITQQSFARPPNPNRNSLFAELARAASSDEEDDEEADDDGDGGGGGDGDGDQDDDDNTTTRHSIDGDEDIETATLASTAPSSPPPPPPPQPIPTSPTPLLAKVLAKPTRTLHTALHLLSGTPAPPSSRRPRKSAIFSDPSLRNRKVRAAPPVCITCGAPQQVRNTLAASGAAWKRVEKQQQHLRVAQPQVQEDVLWLWVRFIIAVVVALGLAVKDGPPILRVTPPPPEEPIDHVREEEREIALRKLEGRG